MKSITLRGLALTALLGAMSLGCARGSTMNWLFGDWNYDLGYAHSANATKQIANPDVIDAESKPVDGIDGRNAEDVMAKYHRKQNQQRTSAQPSIINIGTGAR